MSSKTKRDALDFYPTPRDVVAVVREFMVAEFRLTDALPFLDPAAGEGHLIAGMRDDERIGSAHWSAIEIHADRADALEMVAENVIHADALATDWPGAVVVANPPFSLLDEFWSRVSAHRARHGVPCAVLTPVAWWNAEKRASYTRPDVLLSLGWRPSFRAQNGPAHKGSQDFAWSILAPSPCLFTRWMRVEKPPASEAPQLDLAGVA